MGQTFSVSAAECKERGGHLLIIEGTQIKRKDLPSIALLPDEFPQLQALTVATCKLKEFPSDLGKHLAKCKDFATLKLENLELSTFPETVADIPNLRSLSIAGNAIVARDIHLICKLKHLVSLDVSGNQLTNMDDLCLPSLEVLKASKNQLAHFPRLLSTITTIKVLNLSENKLTKIDEKIEELHLLEELYLKANEIVSVPREIGKLHRLRILDLSENQLKELPIELRELKQLIKLELQHNHITEFPEQICHLSLLQVLKLNDNKLTSLPSSIDLLSHLIDFHLQENEISSLPSQIGGLVSLRKLYLEYNRLTELPIEMQNLKKLIVLILHHNNFSKVPQCIKEMRSLLRLALDDNPIDASTLQTIRDDGALVFVEKDFSESIFSLLHPKAKFLTLLVFFLFLCCRYSEVQDALRVSRTKTQHRRTR
jgi:Leucine-rich repeat (LRR) protein